MHVNISLFVFIIIDHDETPEQHLISNIEIDAIGGDSVFAIRHQ